jgi:hypothetical protein
MTDSKKSGATKRLLQLGDVLRTHAHDEYWGCALVLAVNDGTEQFDPMCLIGITDFVDTKKYGFADIDFSSLEIAIFERQIRVKANEYRRRRTEVCIQQYARKLNKSVDRVGCIDVRGFSAHPLTFEVGDGSNGKYPLCGPVGKSLGSEAIIAWRRVNDQKRWLLESEANRAHNETALAAIKGT